MSFARSEGCDESAAIEAPATTMLIACAIVNIAIRQHQSEKKRANKRNRTTTGSAHIDTVIFSAAADAVVLIALPRLGAENTGFRKTC